jgi:dihydrofolate reductase
VSRLKELPGKNILVFGSGKLVNTLMEHDVIDEYRLMVFPVVLGGGRRRFGDGVEETALELVGNDHFETGVVVLTYRLAEKKAEE